MSQIVSRSTKLKEERDHLTNLLNRKTGIARMNTLLASALEKASTFFVVLIDINDLGEINKAKGHDFGDQILMQVAKRIQEDLHDSDFALRLSGDELLCVYSQTRAEELDERWKCIFHKLEVDGKEIDNEISFSHGKVEVDPQLFRSVQEIIIEVDSRMFQDKKHYHLEKARRLNEFHESDEARRFVFPEEHLLDALMQSTDDYIYVCNLVDNPSTFRYSKAMVEEFALPSEVIENAAEVWGSRIHEADKKAFLEGNQEIADGLTDEHNVEYRAKNKDGKWIWLRCRGHVQRNEKKEAILFAGFITNLGRKNKVDHLTGLFNKFEFEDTINQLINKSEPEAFTVLMLDMDEFSTINKLYNSRFGDEVLELTAQYLQSILPENAKIFRNEGDEFYLILREEHTKKDIVDFFKKLQSTVNKQRELDGKKYHCTISAGCARFPEDATDYVSLSKSVGYALEHSKRSGRNCMTFFDPHMLHKEIEELDMIEQLRYSVEHNFEGFHLHFQPQVVAKSGRVIGAEALARWQCTMYGNVPPLTFIPLLEKSGMIIAVGKWIFEQAVIQCKGWTSYRPEFGVSINLSYLQLNDSSFLRFMKDILRKYEVNPANIVVEMTESHMMKSSEMVKESFLKIRELGIRIAMDDFGTGYSSLGALKNTPADIVKIDKAFMKNILVDDFDITFIKFIVRLCHNVGISVLLEGVETHEEYEVVKKLGLDFIQGYFFGKPMESDSVKKILN